MLEAPQKPRRMSRRIARIVMHKSQPISPSEAFRNAGDRDFIIYACRSFTEYREADGRVVVDVHFPTHRSRADRRQSRSR